MSYSAKAIANEFLKLADYDSESLTQMKLQKLVYIAHGFSLAIMSKPLIEENVQAWQYGPVIPSLYHEFKGYRGGPITSPATNVIITDDFEVSETAPTVDIEDTDTKELLDAVWGKYKKYSGPNLSDMTHREGTPWDKTFLPGVSGLAIDNNIISNHYKSLIGE